MILTITLTGVLAAVCLAVWLRSCRLVPIRLLSVEVPCAFAMLIALGILLIAGHDIYVRYGIRLAATMVALVSWPIFYGAWKVATNTRNPLGIPTGSAATGFVVSFGSAHYVETDNLPDCYPFGRWRRWLRLDHFVPCHRLRHYKKSGALGSVSGTLDVKASQHFDPHADFGPIADALWEDLKTGLNPLVEKGIPKEGVARLLQEFQRRNQRDDILVDMKFFWADLPEQQRII